MTGDTTSSSTDSNVFITIVGENGDTGKRWLKKNRDSSEPFGKGSVSIREFELKLNLIVYIKAVENHDICKWL